MDAKSKLPLFIKDTREKRGWTFRESRNCAGMIERKLDFGDYTIEGHEDLINIERKANINELCVNFGKKRKQFMAEMKRMVAAGVKFKYVIIEDHWSSMEKQRYNSWKENTILANIHAFEIMYDVHFICAGNARRAARIARSLMIKAHSYRVLGKV